MSYNVLSSVDWKEIPADIRIQTDLLVDYDYAGLNKSKKKHLPEKLFQILIKVFLCVFFFLNFVQQKKWQRLILFLMEGYLKISKENANDNLGKKIRFKGQHDCIKEIRFVKFFFINYTLNKLCKLYLRNISHLIFFIDSS